MKSGFRLLLLAILTGVAGLTVFAQSTVKPSSQMTVGAGGAVMLETKGTVTIQVGTEPAQPYKPGQPLRPGSIVQTGPDSSATIGFPDGQICILGEQTQFRITEYRYDPKDLNASRVSLNLIVGSLRMVLGEIGQKNPANVHVQVGVATMGILPDPARADASVVVQGGPVAVTVQEGKVVVFMPSGQSRELPAGQGMYLGSDGQVMSGGANQLMQELGKIAGGPEIAKLLQDMFGLNSKIAQTVITLATVTAALKGEDPGAGGDAQKILDQLASLPPTEAVPEVPVNIPPSGGTPSTGGGGGGQPCAASCN